MSTSLRISDETKDLLERLKREDETYDDLINRLASNEQPINIGAWGEEEAEQAREAVKRSRESFGQ